MQGGSYSQICTCIRAAREIPADAKKPHVQHSKVLSGCIHAQLVATARAGRKGVSTRACEASDTAGVV